VILEEHRAALYDLLARIHGDDGHYIEERGLERAIEDAHYLIAQWREHHAEPIPKDEDRCIRAVYSNRSTRCMRPAQRNGFCWQHGGEGGKR
jgi:hypothetical protein